MNDQRDRLLELLRTHGTTFRDVGRDLGARMGLHATDAAALVEILEAQDRGEPLTQSGLSHRVGLTGGATSSLLNRLEEAGHVRRARDSADRRVVTLHATDGVDARVDDYFDPLTGRVDAMMGGYSPETLAEIERFLTEYLAILTDHLDHSA
jgi:MarR family transcriptional regulator, organic hydroperoxide resistance regulator